MEFSQTYKRLRGNMNHVDQKDIYHDEMLLLSARYVSVYKHVNVTVPQYIS